MKMKYAFWVCSVLVFFSCSKESLDAELTELPETRNVVAVEQELLGVVNEHRKALGMNLLEFSEEAYEHANNHNAYMIVQGALSHDNFSSRASALASQTDALFVAENVAKDYDSAVAAFEGWLASSNHKKTMEGEFTHTAVSVKDDGQGHFFFTQLFFR
ncbi:MAG: CAP domain-containing protein [Bacteroidota bacterium]